MTAPLQPGPDSRPAFLSVQGLNVSAGAQPLVQDLSFDIAAGECLGVIGESGSGKTLAARAILGLLPAGVHATAGRILLDGEDLLGATAHRLQVLRGPTIGMVFQEPLVSLNPAHRIGAQMAEGLRLHTRLTHNEIQTRCLAMLERIGIDDPVRCLSAYPHEFSGGMRQRIMLASVMLLNPRVLIADEPTTALDTLTQKEVLDLMQGLAREHGTSILLITHNLGLVSRYAQRAVVMRNGRAVETGDVQRLLREPSHDYTRTLIEAMPRRAADSAGPSSSASPLIQTQDLRVSYPGARVGLIGRRPSHDAVQGVNLRIDEGQTVAVVGGSGCGKTSLGRAILQLTPLAGGQVLFRGEPVDRTDRAALRRFRLACQLVFQDPYSSLNPKHRVRDIVAEPLRLVPGMGRVEAASRVDQVLEEVGLEGLGQRFAHQLSGGQRQRVAIARAIVRRPAFVVADEPVSALDMTIQAQVLALFRELQRQHGFACLFISHDLAAVEQVADQVIVMQHGRVVEEGTRDQIFDAPSHPYTRLLLQAAPRLPARSGHGSPPRGPSRPQGS
ncbi:MAG: dipeptide ABC transporter ATP-binding protein [Rubrivivax sp.]